MAKSNMQKATETQDAALGVSETIAAASEPIKPKRASGVRKPKETDTRPLPEREGVDASVIIRRNDVKKKAKGRIIVEGWNDADQRELGEFKNPEVADFFAESLKIGKRFAVIVIRTI